MNKLTKNNTNAIPPHYWGELEFCKLIFGKEFGSVWLDHASTGVRILVDRQDAMLHKEICHNKELCLLEDSHGASCECECGPLHIMWMGATNGN